MIALTYFPPLWRRVSAYRCPGCDFVYNDAEGAPREGFPAGHAVERDSRGLGLPGLRGP